MIHTFVKPRWTACLVAVIAMTAVSTVSTQASALSIKITSITAAPSASSGFLPNDRLGLTESTVGSNTVTHIINKSDCEAILAATNPVVRVTWNWTDYASDALTGVSRGVAGTPAPRYAVKMATPDNTCSTTEYSETDASADKCSFVASEKAFTFVGVNLADVVSDVDLRMLMGSPTNCEAGRETKASVFFILGDAGTNVQISGVPLDITIDTLAPTGPTVNALSSGNENLKVSWTTADDATTKYSRVYWSKVPFSASKPFEATSKSALLTGSSYQITGLTNGETYYVAVTSIDDNENESASLKVLEGSPVPVQDLWQSYKANGGASEGGYYGCSAQPNQSTGATGTGALALLMLLVGALLLARRRQMKTMVISALMLTTVAVAMPGQSYAVSPRTMSLDLRGAYYTPMIDREFSKTNGATPYGSMMTEPSMLYGAAIDWRLLHGFGELGVGFSVGYWSQNGKALRLDGSNSDDEVELLVVPVTLDVVYRFNWLAEKYNFPLVPYVRGGLAYGFWWMSDGTGETSTYTGPDNKVLTGSGGVAGFHGTVGMRLLLDVFEPKAARGFDIEMGVNHSYLFIEYQRLSLTNFGDAKALDLSDDILVFGLAFDL